MVITQIVVAQQNKIILEDGTKYIERPALFIDYTEHLDSYWFSNNKLGWVPEIGDYPFIFINEASEREIKKILGKEADSFVEESMKNKNNKFYVVRLSNCSGCDSSEIGRAFLEILKMTNKFTRYSHYRWFPVVTGMYDFEFYLENLILKSCASDINEYYRFINKKLLFLDKGSYIIISRDMNSRLIPEGKSDY